MPAICVLGDECTGHSCFPPRPNIEASGQDVLVNGKPVHLEGDRWDYHKCPHKDNAHDGYLLKSSGSVNINGIGVGRTGDPISCGSKVGEGSPDVNAGD